MVGNSVNCYAEMSADIASIPSWKIALLERKRLHDKELSCSMESHTPSGPLTDHQAAGDAGVPVWKRDILARKQNQKNSFVFLAKSGPSGDSHSSESLPSINNGHVHSLVYDSLCYTTDPPVVDTTVVDIDINETTENQPVEERLLPIHQNPILRLDLKKRHQSSSSSTRSSLSPKVTCTSAGSNEHSSTVSSVSSHVAVTPDAVNEEVFCNENDVETEVAYGKGFVHKLLMKFSHLSSSGSELAPNNRLSRQKCSSLSDGSGSQRRITQDLESLSYQPFSGMPITKIHSVDDLLHETKFSVRIDRSDSVDELDLTATYDHMNGDLTMHLDHYDVGKNDVPQNRNSSSSEIQEALPFANIVSSARSLFESLAVHSASQKRPPSPAIQNATSSRFSYTGTLERSKQLRGTSVTKMQEAGTPKKIDQSYDSLSNSVKSTKDVLQSSTCAVTVSGELPKNKNARIEDDAEKSVQTSFDGRTNVSVINSSHPASGNVLNRGSTSSSTLQTLATHSSSNNNTQLLKSTTNEPEQEHVMFPTFSIALSKNAAESSRPFTDTSTTSAAKPVHLDTSLLSTQLSDNKENVKIQPASSSKKPQPALRPGKLVIRPASNLVAAKTSSEYLELTKFNDVRKGEFAPPLKKERMDPRVHDDDDVDRVDSVAGDSVIMEEYVFTGAGVILGRSLLTKTNKNKSVNTWHLFLV